VQTGNADIGNGAAITVRSEKGMKWNIGNKI